MTLLAFDEPIPAPEERRLAGKALRQEIPRSAHAVWEPGPDRRDPIEVLVESNSRRMPDLVPLRYSRMAMSPFAFLRGSALVMAYDLAMLPRTPLEVRLCGDAHLANFGLFASPERRLVFDLNDFDEAAPGPFEWDVKRLAASIVVAAREAGHDAVAARRAVLEAVAAYRDWTERFAGMTHLEVWYARIEVADLIDSMNAAEARVMRRQIAKVSGKNHLRAFSKLTEVVDGRRRLIEDPPVLMHMDDLIPDLPKRLLAAFAQYRETLTADRQALFDRYRFVDFARKVVGVGSVGTRCWVAVFQGPNGGPLFLQVKEAGPSAPGLALDRVLQMHHGQRVVEGQRMLQATSDIMLGWATDDVTGHEYFVRQLWDSKGSIEATALPPAAFNLYATYCGWALARAHARTGDSVSVFGYIGKSERFGEAIADWAEAYADQTERDHKALLDAIERGLVPTL